LLHIAQALGRIRKWVGPVDDRREPPAFDELGHSEQLLPFLLRRERAQPPRDEQVGHDRLEDKATGPNT